MVRLLSFFFAALLSVSLSWSVQAQISRDAMGSARRMTVRVSVDRVNPSAVKLSPGGSDEAVIKGAGLSLSGLSLEVKDGQGSREGGKVIVALGDPSGSSSRKMTVRIGKGAVSDEYTVVLKGPGTNISLPFKIEVTAPKVSPGKAVRFMSPAPAAEGSAAIRKVGPVTPEITPQASATDLKKRMSKDRGKSRLLTRTPSAAGQAAGTPPYTVTAPAAIPGSSYALGRRRTSSSEAGPVTLTAPARIPMGSYVLGKGGKPGTAPHALTDTAPAPLHRGTFGAALAPAKPMSGDGVPVVTMGKMRGGLLLEVPKTVLEVRLLYKDMEKWGRRWQDTPAMKLEFRWQTMVEGVTGGRWEVSQGAGAGSVVLSGNTDAPPGKGSYGRFFVDFKELVGLFDNFSVRVRPLRGQHLGVLGGGEEFSPPVRVTIAPSGEPPTEFTDPAMGGPVIATLVVQDNVSALAVEENVSALAVVENVSALAVPEQETAVLGDGKPGGSSPQGSIDPSAVPRGPLEKAPLPAQPISGEVSPVNPAAVKDAGFVKLPGASLEVQHLSGDLASWGRYTQESTPAVRHFRWRATEKVRLAAWQVSLDPDFRPNLWKESATLTEPKEGKYGFFSVDFRPFAEHLHAFLQYSTQYSFFLRILYYDTSGEGASAPVEVRVTGESPPTVFE